MRNSGLFISCLIASVAIHATVLVSLPTYTIAVIGPTASKRTVEVFYEQSGGRMSLAPPSEYIPLLQKMNPLPKIETSALHESVKREMPKEENSVSMAEKPITQKEDVSFKRSVFMPYIPGEKFKSPEYKSYYQVIREKIRKYAYYYYRKLQRGEVTLSFSLSSSGELIEASVNKQKSSKDDYLCDIALRSVTEASPYPPFPAKMKNSSRQTFNIIISFELK